MIRLVMKVCFLGALAWIIISFDLISFSSLLLLMQHPESLGLAAVLTWLTIPVGALRWHILLKSQGIRLPWAKTIWLTWFGIFANNYVPASLGSDFSRAVYLFRIVPDHKTKAVISIIGDRVTALAGILLVIAVFSLSLLTRHDLPRWVVTLTNVTYGIIILFACTCVYFRYRPASHSITNWIVYHFGHTCTGKHAGTILSTAKNYKDSPMSIFQACFLSLANTLLMVAAFYTIAQATDYVQLDFMTLGFTTPLSLIVNMLPFSPGGLGLGEAGFAQISRIVQPGAYLQGAGSIFLAYRLVTLCISIPGILLLARSTPANHRG